VPPPVQAYAGEGGESTDNRSYQRVHGGRVVKCLGYAWRGYDFKLHPVTKAQFGTIEVLVAKPMTQWGFRIVPYLAGGNASATCLKMLVMRFSRCAMTYAFEFASMF